MAPEAPPYSQDSVLEIIHHIQKVSKFSTWSPALRAAPEAIVVMAVCLRAASHPDAKAISLDRTWQARDGTLINLPYVLKAQCEPF